MLQKSRFKLLGQVSNKYCVKFGLTIDIETESIIWFTNPLKKGNGCSVAVTWRTAGQYKSV